jgi:probable rRNA maturation factor
MNKVMINAEDIPLPSWSDALTGFVLKVLDEIKHDNWELSVLLCGDKTITALNKQYRGKNEATDILSFNLGTEIQDGDNIRYLPGDIVISLDTLKENALYFQTTQDEELRRLLIHGILHLNGMDHFPPGEVTGGLDPMIALQEDILDKLKDERIIPQGGECKE